MTFFIVIFVSIVSPLFFIRIISRVFYIVWLYQVKEYRLDRIITHFKETKEGRKFFLDKRAKLLWLLLFITPFFFMFSFMLLPYLTLAAIIFSLEVKDEFLEIIKRTNRKPVFTLKAFILVSLTIVTIAVISALFGEITLLFNPAKLIIVDRLLPFVIVLLMLVLSIPSIFVKRILMEMARRKRIGMKDLIVIGVTGSYGKSLTKELIADFLSVKYNVLRTPGSVNTDLGIALFILQNLRREHEVFVVEIGAYKLGEISAVCKMVKPTIGVLTGINEQHLSLFGSIENTRKAKFELIESLPTDGMAFFNGDDKATLAMSKWSKLENIFIYSSNQLSTAIRSKKNPFLSNVAGAVLLATKLGVEPLKLQQVLDKAIALPGLKTATKGDVAILDDSFNTNPNGFITALDILATNKRKKVLVTPGIIELGSESDRIHKELGEKIGKICDVVVLTNENFGQPIRAGLEKTGFDTKHLLIPKREEMASVIKEQMKGKTAILLEGRMPAEITKFI